MKLLFEQFQVLFPELQTVESDEYVVVENQWITYVGKERPTDTFDRVISGKNKLLMPGLYNTHAHSAMTLFRGYGEDLPLMDWLNTKIFPAEDLLTPEAVFIASQVAIAEQIKNGIVSFSDMYFFCDQTAKAVAETGIKANLSRCLVSFDPTIAMKTDKRFLEATELVKEYHNTADGRIKIDMSLHAEYTNVEEVCVFVGNYAKEKQLQMQLHLSETKKEHQECIERHGKTPAKFFFDAGVFDVPTTAAHCVYATEEDMDIFAEKGVTVAHNVVSNLKLGSGVMPLVKMLEKGINVTFGTDGAASNNTLDILKEMSIAAILQKGIYQAPEKLKATELPVLATANGAKAQGRLDCGKIAVGCKADLIALDTNAIHMIPAYDWYYALIYSANSSNVQMTMVDGTILYENGEYKTLDIEKVKYTMKQTCANYFTKQK